MLDIAIATCASFPNLDAHDELLLTALRERGISAQPLVWDDLLVDWSLPTLTLTRSTWGYYRQHRRFLEWAEGVSRLSLLWNPFEILKWNTHKSYLRDLQAKGIPIVPTIWLNQGEHVDLTALLVEYGWQKIVIKPAVSASSYATILVSANDVALGQFHLNHYLPDRDMLIQPFLSTITTSYERSLIFIDGEFTHAIKRVPALDLEPNGEIEVVSAHDDEIAVAKQTLRALPYPIVYARVDLIRDEEEMVRLMELELVEPDLWLGFAPHAVDRFVGALERKLDEARRRESAS